jgi:dTDP-4-amino-4,6-dideoxygalactose transaminase
MQALGIGPGDEVIVPSFTFVSTANAVVLQGARPVFCDIESTTLNVDPADLARRITPRTRAVVVVHYGGVPADMDGVRAAIGDGPVRIVEDAAHAIGSTYRGRPVGVLGDLAAFSFHETKNLSCGEGGALVTDDAALAARAEILREKGTDRAAFLRGDVDKYTWVDRGSSYLLSDLLAAVLAVQVDRYDELQADRRRAWEAYRDALAPLASAGRIALPTVPADRSTNHHIFWLLARDAADRDRTLSGLRARGVRATFHFVPLDSSPFARRILGVSGPPLPVTRDVADRLIRLPLFAALTDAEIARVIAATREALAEG